MNREKEIVKTSLVGIIGNVFLVAFKAFVGIIAGSVSIIMISCKRTDFTWTTTQKSSAST